MNLKIAALLFAGLPSSWGDGRIRGLTTKYHSPRREGEPCHHGCHKGLTCVNDICAAASLENEDQEGVQADEEDLITKALSHLLPIGEAHPYKTDIERCIFDPACRGTICNVFEDKICVDSDSSCVQLGSYPWFSCSCPEGMVNARDCTRCELPPPDGSTFAPPQSSALISYIKENGCANHVDSCPSDTFCILNEESGEPECYCKLSWELAVEGVSCYEMEHHVPVDPASGDEACDAEEAGCGEDAECAIGSDGPICYCEGTGSVPKGASCKSYEEKREKQVNESLRQEGGEVGSEEEGGRRDQWCYGTSCQVSQCFDYGHYTTFMSVGETPWTDSQGNDCSWYTGNKCTTHGNSYESFDSAGVPLGTAQYACCHCGGGCQGVPVFINFFWWYRFFTHYRFDGNRCEHGSEATDKFTIVFASDMENQYRDHHDEWCGQITEHIKTVGNRGYNYPNGRPVENPSLVIFGGDISDSGDGWRSGDLRNDEAIWDTTYQRLYDANIPVISILGNHDELDTGYTPSAAKSEATDFVARSFRTAASTSSDFTYQEIHVPDAVHPYYAANFRGLQIATFNNAYEGKNNIFTNAFTPSTPILSFGHQPFSSLNKDSGNSIHDNIDEYKTFLSTFQRPYHFSGHTHRYADHSATSSSNWVKEYVAPYPHVNGNHAPGYLAIEVSPTYGVIQVKRIEYDYQDVTGCLSSGSGCVANFNCNRCCPTTAVSLARDTCDATGCYCGTQTPGHVAHNAVHGASTAVVEAVASSDDLDDVADWFMGAWSDRRLKHNVKQIGTSDMGIPIYTFNYSEGVKDLANGAGMDTESTFQGVMAQDLLELKPDAVVLGSNGYYKVNYSEIDVEFLKMN